MAVTIPTVDELYNQILDDIATEFSVDASELGATYQTRAKVQAGMLYTFYLALSGVQKNTFYDLAEYDQLVRYGKIMLGRSPSPAEAGEYEVTVTGTSGATISAGTQFKADDDTDAAGYLFIVDSDFELSADTDTLTIRALTSGTNAALTYDDTLTATAPITNVDSEVTVSEITTTAVAAETTADYRQDVIDAAQIEPQGGSPGDYRLWCSEVSEIRNVYPFAKSASPGDIQIYIEATEENTKDAEITGVPTDDTIEQVYAVDDDGVESGVVIINSDTEDGRKPIGVFSIEALAVTPVAVDIYFTTLSDEDYISSIQTAIEALLYDVRPFVAGADILDDKNDKLTIGMVIAEVITLLDGTGETYETLTMTVDGSEVTTYQFLYGYYPYLNIIYNDGEVVS